MKDSYNTLLKIFKFYNKQILVNKHIENKNKY
jgi:hypothetical protein